MKSFQYYVVSNSLLSNSQISLLEKRATSKQILGDAFYWRIFMKPLSSLSLSPDSSWEWCRTQKTTAACWMDGRTVAQLQTTKMCVSRHHDWQNLVLGLSNLKIIDQQKSLLNLFFWALLFSVQNYCKVLLITNNFGY